MARPPENDEIVQTISILLEVDWKQTIRELAIHTGLALQLSFGFSNNAWTCEKLCQDEFLKIRWKCRKMYDMTQREIHLQSFPRDRDACLQRIITLEKTWGEDVRTKNETIIM